MQGPRDERTLGEIEAHYSIRIKELPATLKELL